VKSTITKDDESKQNGENQKEIKGKSTEAKFKTPNKRIMSDDNSSISSVSDQEDGNSNEFNELWTDIKIKTYSETKGIFYEFIYR
jgi:hypothetical protein